MIPTVACFSDTRVPPGTGPKTWPAGAPRARGKGVAILTPAAARLGRTLGPCARARRGPPRRAGRTRRPSNDLRV